MPQYTDTSKDWFFFAQSDLQTAQVMFREKVYHMVCFHAQQAVEKSFKAVLRHAGTEIPKTHSLAKLFHDARNVQSLDIAEDDVFFVDQFYAPTRYPDTLPGGLPEGLPNEVDAQRALGVAETVVSTVGKLFST